MTEKFLDSLRIFLGLFRLDLKQLLQRITNPIVIVVLLLILVSFALTLGTFHYITSVYAPLHGVSNPKFGLGGYEPLPFYLCIVVALLFALRLPSYREESIKNVVITYREPSNFLLTLSRVLTPVFLVFGCIVATAFAYQVVASIDVANNPGIVESFELQSLIFVLVELFVAMLFWTSLAVFITQVFKSATIGFFGTVVLLVLQAWISPLLPSELGSFTFGYGAANLYVSELAPTYWEMKHVAYFLSIVSLAFAFIFATSWYHDRTDSGKKVVYQPMIVVLASIGIVCQALVHSFNLMAYSQHQTWIQAYEDATTNSHAQQASIEAIEGDVSIKPGSKLSLNLNYLFAMTHSENFDAAQNDSAALWLAFNPGMKVQSVQCSNADLVFAHKNGILKIDVESCDPNNNDEYSIDLVASGKPVPHYLVKHIPRAGSSDVVPQMVRLMGQKSSIFTSDYVALTPTSHWYPQLLTPPARIGGSSSTHAADVSLTMDLVPKSWTIVTSGGKLMEASSSQDGRALLSGKFQALGLLATDFRVSTHSNASTDVNVLVHKRHAKRLERNELLADALVAHVSDAISKLESYGIDYPFDQFTIVEAPSTLSLLNHENSVDLGMESIVMFRESGIPFARLFRLEDWQQEYEQAEIDESPMAGFHKDQVGFMKSLYWTNPIFNHTYEDAIVESLVSNRINRTDEHSNLAELVLESLLFNLLEGRNHRFDFDLANSLALESRTNIRYIWWHRHGGSFRLDLQPFQGAFMDSNRFWESIERSFSSADFIKDQNNLLISQNNLRKQRFRVLRLSELLADSYDEQTIATTLTDILNTDASKIIDLDRISGVAESHNMEIASLIQNTLLNTSLAGINFSVAHQLEFNEPNENGHRFNTVLHLRNSEDSVGYVSFHVVEIQEIVQEGQTLRTVANDFKLGPFELQEKSSYQLEVNTANLVGNLQANTFLSRNRGRVELAITNARSENELSAPSDTTNSWFSFASSQWNSKLNEDEIIVDDLDPGFEIPSTNYRETSNFWTLGTYLFRHYFPREEGMDNGLPIGQNSKGPWVRAEGLASWGRYRHTFALGDSAKPGIHPVSFNTNLPKKGKWALSYHLPDVIFFLEFQQAKLGVHNIDVNSEEQDWSQEIKTDNWVVGWNEISRFDIASPGQVRVSVSNVSDESFVVADAIKWTYLD